MRDETLLDKAEHNVAIAREIMRMASDDEAFLNYAAYHVQQAAEMALKHVLEENGIAYPKTHEIERLVALNWL